MGDFLFITVCESLAPCYVRYSRSIMNLFGLPDTATPS